jgi:hypothetical protein
MNSRVYRWMMGVVVPLSILTAVGAGERLLLAGQNLQFDVASIKKHVRAAGGPIVPQSLLMEPTRLGFINASLLACIQAAYGIPGEGRPDYRLAGGPDWLATERFDIEAKSDRTVSSQLSKLGAIFNKANSPPRITARSSLCRKRPVSGLALNRTEPNLLKGDWPLCR